MHRQAGRGETIVPDRFQKCFDFSSVLIRNVLDRRPFGGRCYWVTGMRQCGVIDSAKCPIAKEQAAAIFLRELAVSVASHARRRATAEVGDWCDHVRKVRRHPPERAS